MKHTLKITMFLILFFLLSQLIGLSIINKDVDVTINEETGKPEATHPPTALGERPKMSPINAFLYIISAVLIGTGLVLLIIKFRKVNLWKVWFFLAVWLTTTVALGVFVNKYIAYAVCLFFAAWKVFRPNIYVHNLVEIFMYAGIALILVDLGLNVVLTIALLLAISAYDVYAVWRSKHMVKMAEFQTKSNVFAGLFIPYSGKGISKVEKTKPGKALKGKGRVAILGGGDIAFPLIFSGVVMEKYLINVLHLTKISALLESFIITAFVTLALSLLLFKSEKGKFYPAMPFITLGCLVGYGVVWLINYFF